MRKLLYFLPLIFLFASCEVEFSPNAKWKNIPVVYCLLDQDDDTTWVRVQRCYLAEGSIYDYGQISDSINYPQGAIDVLLHVYENGKLKDSVVFNYMERNVSSGLFAQNNQPIYWSETKGKLKESYTYALIVRNAADGAVLATTDPIPLIKKNEAKLFTKPSITIYDGDTIGSFAFYDNMGTSSTTLYCYMKWNALENARLYQPIVRFYYEEQGVRMHVDLKCPAVSAKSTDTYYSRDLFLNELKQQLQADTARKRYIPQVDLFLTACTEDLNTYLTTVTSGSAVSQNAEVYNNIKGGVGLFAARRTHLYSRMPADASLGDRGLLHFLEELGVGLY